MRKKFKMLLGVLLFVMTAVPLISLSEGKVQAQSASYPDFQMKGDTLVKYTGTASAVSIPTFVKNIGDEAFAGHSELVKVNMPAYMETIGYNAFNGCTSLETVSIPDMVTEIGNGAFGGCTGLKSVYLGKKLRQLGSGAFANCTSLNTLKMSKDNTVFSYDSGILYSKDKTILYCMLPGYVLNDYRMPATVKTIKDSAFWGCPNLKKVEIGSSVKEISDFAFANCLNLEKVLFSYSVYHIGAKAFAGCINLGDIEIPESVADIHTTAFDGCPKLNIIAEEGSKAAEYDEQRETSNVAYTEYQDITHDATNGEIIEDKENDGSADAGQNKGGLLGQSVVVGGDAVVFIDNSRSNVLSGNEQPDFSNQSKTAVTEVMSGGQLFGGFPKYTIVNHNIAARAYYDRNDLTEYNMPQNIKAIGDFAFARSSLASIVIPEGTEKIGYGAFYHCDLLEDVEIPNSVTEIEPSAFDKTLWMEERLKDRRNPFTIAGDGILIACVDMGSKVEIPEGVKHIGAEVFKDRKNLASVVLPNSLVSIGEDAFAGCGKLTSISGGNNLSQIKDRAFAGCPISTIKIPASVKEIGLKAFDISETQKEDGTKTAVFLGKEIPKVSYEKTATRLTNEGYREAPFKGVRLAVVDDSIASAADVEGTVLDYETGGFRGFVCSVVQAANGDTPGQLRIKFCVMKEADVEEYTIPPTVTLYGKKYEIVNPEDAVVFASDEREEPSEEGTITVEVSSSTMSNTPSAIARLEGNKKDYILKISDNNSDGNAISTAYKKTAAGNKMISLQVFNMDLYDAEKMIPISRLGNQQVTVIVPKPKGIAESGLKVVSMDEEGQLEKVESRIVTVEGQPCVQFSAKHFSVYGFYN